MGFKYEHINIIKIYEIIWENNCIYFVMEYAEQGDLYNYLRQNENFSES